MLSLNRKNVRVDLDQVRYLVRLEGEDNAMGSADCWNEQQVMLRAIVDSPDLLFCGPSRPQMIRMSHNGTTWIIEAEALVQEAMKRS